MGFPRQVARGKRLSKMTLHAILLSIWKERNERIFNHEERPLEKVFDLIKERAASCTETNELKGD